MEVTELGMVRDPVKPEQLENAPSPMEVTELGMVRDPVKPEQYSKAELAMVVILGSRVISPEQQDEEGVFLLMQLSVIPWTVDEKRRRSQRGREIAGLDPVPRVP
jgi:hypothetical protein